MEGTAKLDSCTQDSSLIHLLKTAVKQAEIDEFNQFKIWQSNRRLVTRNEKLKTELSSVKEELSECQQERNLLAASLMLQSEENHALIQDEQRETAELICSRLIIAKLQDKIAGLELSLKIAQAELQKTKNKHVKEK
jgi:hypothetical protein